MFARTLPKLAVYTHLVFLASQDIEPATIEDLITETRETYAGPLEVGEDLMSFAIGDTICVDRRMICCGDDGRAQSARR